MGPAKNAEPKAKSKSKAAKANAWQLQCSDGDVEVVCATAMEHGVSGVVGGGW
jgi:hypothetical protein